MPLTQDLGPVGQTVEHGACDLFSTRRFGPLLEWQNAGHIQTSPLLDPPQDLEQQFRSRLYQGQMPEFVGSALG